MTKGHSYFPGKLYRSTLSLGLPKGAESFQHNSWRWWLFPCMQVLGGGGGGLTNHSLTTLFLFCFCEDQLMHTKPTLYARISPQRLGEMRRLNKCSLTSCAWAHFADRFPHYAFTAKSAHSDFVGSRVYACLGVTSWHLHFGQNDRDIIHATEVKWTLSVSTNN